MKNLTLKLALVAVATFIGFGASAQTPWTAFATRGDYTRSDTTIAVYDKVTVGKSMPFWVYPSVAYNASYVAPTNATPYTPTTGVGGITTNVISGFAWTSFSGASEVVLDAETTVAADFTSAGALNNYVEASWSTTGLRSLKVIETPVGGICAGTAIRFNISVIPEPSLSINGAVTAFGLTTVISAKCDAALPLAANHTTAVGVTFTNPADADEYPYYLNMTYKVYNLDKLSGTGTIPNVAGVLDYTNIDLSAALADDAKFNGVILASAANGKTNPYSLTAGTEIKPAATRFEVKNSKITIYVLKYTNANGKISRKSDYLAAAAGNWDATTDVDKFSFYPTAATAVEKYIISFPAPVTGPIYHIANSFGF